MALFACTMAAQAQNAGDYVYTDDGRYKITSGENLLSNGDFSQGLDGWLTDGGTPVNTDTFYVDKGGPDGGDCLFVNMKDNGPGTGSSLWRSVPVQAGTTYYIAYSVQGYEPTTTTVSVGENVKNYQNIFFNTDGSITPSVDIAYSQQYAYDWVTMSYAYTPQEDGYIVFYFFAPYVYTRFDDFKVLEAQEVVDDRALASFTERVDAYLNNPLLPNARDILETYKGELQSAYELDDIQYWQDMMSVWDDALSEFLDANSVNINDYITAADFEEQDVPLGKNVTTVGGENGWQAWGDRWTQRDVVEPFTSIWMKREINGSFILAEGGLYQELGDMPAGDYMFSLKVRAAKYANKHDDLDRLAEIRGLKIFINEDSVEMYPIDPDDLTTYTVYSKLENPGKLTIGVYIPADVCNRVDLDGTDLRIIGVTEDYVKDYFTNREIESARTNLSETIDSARVLLASDQYIYWKDSLTFEVDTAVAVRDTATIAASLDAGRSDLEKAISTFMKRNSLYTSLLATIANAEAILDDPDYKEGHDALRQAISDAKAFVGTLSSEQSAETDGLIKAQEAALDKAMNALQIANMTADEKYLFLDWAQQDEAMYVQNLDFENPLTTNSGATLYKENGTFAGHEFNGRLALSEKISASLDASHGLVLFYSAKNTTVLSILNLKEGDQVTLDYTCTGGIYVNSANAWYYDKDGNRVDFVAGEKVAGNQLDNSANADGLGGKVRYVLNMSADGTLDFYFGSSGSTMRISYIGITYAENVVDGIEDTTLEKKCDGKVYNLSGQYVGDSLDGLKSGIYIRDGRKVIVK